VAIGGIAIGVGVTWLIMQLQRFLTRRLGEETGSQILISLLIPFAAYLIAEHLECSGILAAVAAGITMSFGEQSGRASAITRVRRTAVWDTVQFAMNGVIFVLLGEQLPQIAASAIHIVRETGHYDPLWLIVYVISINLALGLLRFAWVWVSLRFTLYRAARSGVRVHPAELAPRRRHVAGRRPRCHHACRCPYPAADHGRRLALPRPRSGDLPCRRRHHRLAASPPASACPSS
jgi:NhaP-type Na+/H+ or K+/H+ antiporter